jgi:hypothetical protein
MSVSHGSQSIVSRRRVSYTSGSMKKQTKIVILDLKGAHCASCIYTIEHLGRKRRPCDGTEKRYTG